MKKSLILLVLTGLFLASCKKEECELLPSCITAVRTDGLVDRSISVGGQEVDLIEFVLTSAISDTITSVTFDGIGVDGFSNQITASLYVEGNIVRTATYRDGKLLFTSLKVATGAKVSIKGTINSSVAIGSEIAFKLVSLTSKSKATLCGSIQSAGVTNAGTSALTITAKPISPKLIPGGSSDVELGRFETEALEGVSIESLVLKGEGNIANRLSNIRLYDAQTGEIRGSASLNNGKVAFDISLYLPVGKKYWLIKANINNVLNVVDGGEFSLSIESVIARKVESGNNANTVFNGTIIGEHRIVRGGITTFTSSGSSNTNVMHMKVHAIGNRVRLQMLEIGLKNDANNSATILLSQQGYGNNELGSFNITNVENNLVVIPGGGLEIQAGQETTLYITLQGFQNSGTTTNGEIKISDIIYEDIFQDGNSFIDGIWTFAGNDAYQVGTQPIRILYP